MPTDAMLVESRASSPAHHDCPQTGEDERRSNHPEVLKCATSFSALSLPFSFC